MKKTWDKEKNGYWTCEFIGHFIHNKYGYYSVDIVTRDEDTHDLIVSCVDENGEHIETVLIDEIELMTWFYFIVTDHNIINYKF